MTLWELLARNKHFLISWVWLAKIKAHTERDERVGK